MSLQRISSISKALLTISIFLIFLFLFCISLSFNAALAQSDKPELAAILGGKWADLQSTAVVYIASSEGYACTGTLVGTREVLTAAHCLFPWHQDTIFRVLVGNKVFTVEKGYVHGDYDDQAPPSLEGSRFDVGMLILTKDVIHIEPAAVIYDLPPQAGEKIRVFGYGTNEISDKQDLTIEDLGKTANVSVDYVTDGVFETSHVKSSASVCPGDSGGPSFRIIGNYSGVVGVTSLGTNRAENGKCSLGGFGLGTFVDIQSYYVQAFLSYFPQISRISGKLMVIQGNIDNLISSLDAGVKSWTPGKLRKYLRVVSKEINNLKPFADGSRLKMLNDIQKKAKKASRIRKKNKLKKAAGKVLRQAQLLHALGVN